MKYNLDLIKIINISILELLGPVITHPLLVDEAAILGEGIKV